jgi:kynurenine formamidase
MKVFDLTMPIDSRTPVFPGSPKQEIRQISTIKENGWNETRIAFNSHFSTHVDAPFHMIENGKKLSDFPIDSFVGDAVVIDARNQRRIEPSLDEVMPGDIVFFYTGHSEKAYSAGFYKNNPEITKKTADALIAKKIKAVGLDSYSADNEPYEAHKLLFRRGILIVENLVNLAPLNGKRFVCCILPLKVMDADGAPCRVIGML